MAALADKLKKPDRALRNGDDEDGTEDYRPSIAAGKTLPGGRKIADLSPADLADALVKLKIPGAQRSNSLAANRALYCEHMRAMHDEAGEHMTTMWKLEHDGDDAESEE